MKKYLKLFIIILLFPLSAFAVENAGFVNNNLWFSRTENVLSGDNIKIYTNIINDGYTQFRGILTFTRDGQDLGNSIVFSLDKEKSQLFTYNWVASAGNHQFGAKIMDAFAIGEDGVERPISNDNLSVFYGENFFVDIDSDGDGLGDSMENSIGTNPSGADTDGDGYNDKNDSNPLDSKIFPGLDTDSDGISDLVDTDIDNDGLYNWEENELGTDPMKYDTDGDGIGDKDDFYPLDSGRHKKEIPTTPKVEPVEEKIIATVNNDITKDKKEGGAEAKRNSEEEETHLTIDLELNKNNNNLPASNSVAEGETSEDYPLSELPRRSFWKATFETPATAIPAILGIIALAGTIIFSGLWLKASYKK